MSARANAEFKGKYRKYFDIALIGSLALHLIAFVFVPHIDIYGYKTDQEELDVIEIPPAVAKLLLEEQPLPPPPRAGEWPIWFGE